MERVAGVPSQPTRYCLGTVTASSWLRLRNELGKSESGKVNELWRRGELAGTRKKNDARTFSIHAVLFSKGLFFDVFLATHLSGLL